MMTVEKIVDIRGSARNYPGYTCRERELQHKLKVFERHLARLLTERVRYCPSCDRHYEPSEVR